MINRFATLEELTGYLSRKHKNLHRLAGVYGYKFLKLADGVRVPFEEVKGLSLKDFDILGPNSLAIDLCALGFEFRKNARYTFNSRLLLNDLAVVNVYDYKTEFFSFGTVDFVYMQLNEAARLQLFTEWILEEPGTIRAQWIANLPDVDKIVAEVGADRKVKVVLRPPQPLDMEASLF